jgi:allophanate hydrolase subunit 1
MLNGGPINSGPVNGLGSQASGSGVTQPIVPGLAFRWQLRVMVGDVDMSSRLSGQVTVDRERGAAGVASFTLQLTAGAVLPMDWVGRVVTIDYETTSSGVSTAKRRFTGRIVTTEWGSLTRLLVCNCGDQLQQRIEKLSVAAVDELIPSYWSLEVFEDPEGRSRWDYAQERLTAVQSSLDSSADGDLRLSTWYASDAADFTFGAGTTVYDSVQVSYADLTSLTNTVIVDASYRFSRLKQLNQLYSWRHPDTDGFTGTQGFCLWRPDSTELPDVAMIKEASSSAGLTIASAPDWYRVILSTPDPCGNGQPWVNNYADLLLGFTLTGSRRWAQAVTENYTMTVVAQTSVDQAGEVISRESLSIEYTNDLADNWESTAFGIDATGADPGSNGHVDERDEVQRASAFECLLAQAKTTIIAAHSATKISWEVPTSMAMEIDLVHTLAIADQGIGARARCCHVYDTFDLAAGTALTTLTIAVMRGGGDVSDPLAAPAYVVEPQPEPEPANPPGANLPTQLGGKKSSPVYDDAVDGFAGNYDNADPTLPVFTRRFQITATEIADVDRDEKTVPIATTYRVAVPNDYLEL